MRDEQLSREEIIRQERKRERDLRLFRNKMIRARERERRAPPPGGLG